MSPSRKEKFYQRLEMAVRSGLSPLHVFGSNWKSRNNTATFSEQIRVRHPGLSPFETAMLEAGERSGHLETIANVLAAHFGSLAASRDAMIRAMLYPLFVLHFAIVVLHLPIAVGQGMSAYWVRVGTLFAIVYGVAFGLFLLMRLLSLLLRTNATVDQLAQTIPILGTMRKDAVTSRFLRTLATTLDAGFGVAEALDQATNATGSAVWKQRLPQMKRDLAEGESLGGILRRCRRLADDSLASLELAEMAGRLDEEMRRQADETDFRFRRNLDLMTEWAPRLLYVGVLLLVASQILGTFGQYVKQFGE